MKLVVLGTAGYHPSDTRQTACLMLPEAGVVLDAGTGFYRVRDYLQTTELDIFLTHAHLDHVIGLTYWYDVVHERRIDGGRVHGLAEKLAAVQRHLFSEPLFPTQPPYEYHPLTEVTPLANGGRLTYFPLEHRGGSIGFRLDWPNHSMAYVTDTIAAVDAPYVQHLRGVDLLVHECNFRDSQAEMAKKFGHSSTSTVAQVALAVGASKLVLTHINPLEQNDDPIGLAAARAIFPATEIASDRMVVEF